VPLPLVNRKQIVNKNTEELSSLEARIKEMEERLKARQAGGKRPSLNQAQLGDNAAATPSSNEQQQSKDEAAEQKARSRPGTARATQAAPSSGNMPPTPGGSEGEYYLVTKADLDDGPR
jgi:hypothetical protein